MARALIVVGLLLVLAGLVWPWLTRLPLGRLPGDLAFQGRHFRVYLPLASSLLLSIVLSLVLRLFK